MAATLLVAGAGSQTDPGQPRIYGEYERILITAIASELPATRQLPLSRLGASDSNDKVTVEHSGSLPSRDDDVKCIQSDKQIRNPQDERNLAFYPRVGDVSPPVLTAFQNLPFPVEGVER